MPGGTRRIALEEAGANSWSLEEGLYRPGEFGCRVFQILDSTGTIRSGAKGRSSGPSRNEECRASTSIEVLADLRPVYVHADILTNSADRASRNQHPPKDNEAEEKEFERESMNDFEIPETGEGTGVVWLLLSWVSRHSTLGGWLRYPGATRGRRGTIELLDGARSPFDHVCDDKCFRNVCDIADNKVYSGVFAMPRCTAGSSLCPPVHGGGLLGEPGMVLLTPSRRGR